MKGGSVIKTTKTIAANLHRLLKTERLCLTKLSQQTDIVSAFLQRILNGTTNSRVDSLELLVKGLRISPAKMISYPG